MKTGIMFLLVFSGAFGLTVRFDERPETYRLYPRDARDQGQVRILGTVLEPGHDSVYVVLTRNNRTLEQRGAALLYRGDSAVFDLSFAIRAELAEYAFRCRVDGEEAFFADSVVAGDVYVISGQSNAATMSCGEWQEFVRSVKLPGRPREDMRCPVVADTQWYLGGEGTWGQEIGKQINMRYHIPVCIINGGVPSTTLGEHLRDDANPMGNRLYGPVLGRAAYGKVREAVKAVFWYQGEFNSGTNADSAYPAQFDPLYRAWMEDYPNVRKVYMIQINTWTYAYSRMVREAARRIAHAHGNVEIMTTVGCGEGYNGHGGYYSLAGKLTRLVARDFYGCPDTVEIRPPEIIRAYYTSSARDRIALEFSQPVYWSGTDTVGGYLKDYFGLDDTLWQAVDSCWFESGNRRIVLKLPDSLRPATLSYLPDYYTFVTPAAMTGPVLWNSRQIGAVTFARFPVEQPAAADTLAPLSLELGADRSSLSRFEALKLRAVAARVAGMLDTNRDVTLASLDTFVVRMEASGIARAHNPGVARVVASLENLRDTLILSVDTSFSPMAWMRFAYPDRRLKLGDTMALGLSGYFNNSGCDGLFSLDTLAALSLDTVLLKRDGARLIAIGAADSTAVIASFAGKECTLKVRIPPFPTVVRRINFQPQGENTVPSIPDWQIDSGGVYSQARGFGWTAQAYGHHDTQADNYLKGTWLGGGEWRMDCADGAYVLRLCSYNYNIQYPGYPSICLGSDTLLRNPAVAGYLSTKHNWITDSRVSISGGQGLRLTVYSGLSYVVLISDDGAEMNLVAGDDRFRVEPELTAKGAKQRGPETLSRMPSVRPNPFNPSAEVSFFLPAGVAAEYGVYDVRGRRLFRAVLEQEAGGRLRSVPVQGRHPSGRAWPSGCYFGRLSCGDGKTYRHTLVLLK